MRRRFMKKTHLYENNYMTVKALEDGLTVKLSNHDCYYSVDGGEWHELPKDTETPSINAKQTISFKGNIKPSRSLPPTFIISKYCDLTGNCMSLLYGDYVDTQDSVPNYAFYRMFYGCKKIIRVSKAFLPAVRLGEYCYYEMFESCSSMIQPPDLPATSLNSSCYSSMFAYCDRLTTAPVLPADTLVYYCYSYMFYSADCLSYIKMLATNISAYGCLYEWVDGVPSTGTFVKSKDATWDTTPGALSDSGVPAGWTVKTE